MDYFANLTEAEVASFTGKHLSRPGLRSCPLAASWVPIFHRVKDLPDVHAICLGWRWLLDNFRSYVIALFNTDGPCGDAAALPHKQVLLGGQCVGVGRSSRLDAALKDAQALVSGAPSPHDAEVHRARFQFDVDVLLEELINEKG